MNHRINKAQAATELAVFGAILIFVVGSIVRSSFDSGLNQNQNLKAMRWAMLQSLYGVRNVNKSRDSASITVIEDRLSPEASKFGSLERTPAITTGSGTLSNTLYMPLDWYELNNIPVMDVLVNGEHFVFSTARFIVYDIQLVGNQVRVWDLTNESDQNMAKRIPKAGNWDDQCTTKQSVTDNSNPPITTIQDVPTPGGCPLFYSVAPVKTANFCTTDTGCTDGSTLSLQQRFDLNRNGIFTDDFQPGEQQNNAMWQWSAVKGLVGSDKIKINADDGVYVSFDVDGDRKEEMVYAVNDDTGYPPNTDMAVDQLNAPSLVGLGTASPQRIQRVFVLDFDKGDMALSSDDTDRVEKEKLRIDSRVGLQTAMSVLTETKNGTRLEIREGKAYVPDTGTFVRSVNKRDQIDIISREFRLSNNTGRYCQGTTVVQPIGGRIFPGSIPNPIPLGGCVASAAAQSPGACFTPGPTGTITSTCYDTTSNTIFIRTRIAETRGHKWVTQTK